jgi:hypothetical protein
MRSAECKISDDKLSFSINHDEAGYYEINLNSKFNANFRDLLLVRNGINYVEKSSGYLSIDPGSSVHVFPVLVRNAGSRSFDFKIISSHPSKGKLKLTNCVARKIPIVGEDFFPPLEITSSSGDASKPI